MSLPPLDVVLGSEFATQRAEPRLRERSAAAWASLLDALRTSQPAAASALAYLARTRLLTPPASEEAAELLLRELQSTSPLAVDAALLLARWAASGRGGARAAAAQAALLWQPGDGGGAAARALLLAAASASPGCPHAAWAAALDALEQRVAEIRVARRLPEALAACGLLVASAQASASAARARHRVDLPPTMDTLAVHDAMSLIGAKMVLEVLAAFENGTAQTTPQSDSGVTYAAKITKPDRIINWEWPAERIYFQIQGLAPLGAITGINNETIKILKAQIEAGDTSKPAGQMLDDALLVNAGNGTALRLLELQRPGKTRQLSAQFLQSYPVNTGIFTHKPAN
jgi:hypothetical protein